MSVASAPVRPSVAADSLVPSGIEPLDERIGGLREGGSYLVVGAPGPEKMVAALQFVHAGIEAGEPCLFVTNADLEGLLGAAAAWGFDLWDAWSDGQLQVLGFKDDFELRAIRSIAPEEVVEELDLLKSGGHRRIAVDPGAMFLTGGARTLLGSTYLAWAKRQQATVLTTFSVDGGAAYLPSSADWLVSATTGRLLLERRGDGLCQITVSGSIPGPAERTETVSLELTAGGGLVKPSSYPARRGVDRGEIDADRLLLMSLGGQHAEDLEAWTRRAFEADVVAEPFEAVAEVQTEARYGGVLIHAPRQRVREAIQACRALRPLTRAAIVFASDDAIRSTDRIQILEAGVDDCLTGGLDFRELGLRIRQAIAAGAKPMVKEDEGAGAEIRALSVAEADRGRVDPATFLSEVERRGRNATLAFFCVLDVRHATLAAGELEERLADQIRHQEGDIVTASETRAAVLLQGARENQIGAFLKRLRSRLGGDANGEGEITIDVLSHPADGDEILEFLRSVGGDAS